MVVMRVIVVLLIVGAFYGLICAPAYVIGQRRGVRSPGVAFVPFVGMTIVLLWSISRRGWLTLFGLIPLVSFFFWIWLCFALPSYHRRSVLWGLVLLVPVLGLYPYAFTLAWRRPPAASQSERRDFAWI